MDKTGSSNVISILVNTGAYLEMQTEIGLKKQMRWMRSHSLNIVEVH